MIVSSILRKQLLKTPAIATRQTPQMQESPVLLDFRANKKPPVDKISFINRWYLICVSCNTLIQCTIFNYRRTFVNEQGIVNEQ